MSDYLTGADLEEIDLAVSDDLIEEMEEEQKMWAEGDIGLPGHKRNTASRYQFYMSQTLPEERLLVLDPDYREKAMAGLYPPLTPVLWYVTDPDMQPIAGPFASQMIALDVARAMGLLTPQMLPQMDPMSGMVVPGMPPPIGSKPSYWDMMLSLGEFPSGWSMFKVKSRDFKNCSEEAGKQIEKGMVMA